jgi:hypothetical protein
MRFDTGFSWKVNRGRQNSRFGAENAESNEKESNDTHEQCCNRCDKLLPLHAASVAPFPSGKQGYRPNSDKRVPHSHEEIHNAIQSAKSELKGSEDCAKIMRILGQKLR